MQLKPTCLFTVLSESKGPVPAKHVPATEAHPQPNPGPSLPAILALLTVFPGDSTVQCAMVTAPGTVWPVSHGGSTLSGDLTFSCGIVQRVHIVPCLSQSGPLGARADQEAWVVRVGLSV